MSLNLGNKAEFTGRGSLPPGKAVHLIVMDDVGQIYIALQGTEEVVGTFAVGVTVAPVGDQPRLLASLQETAA